MKYLIEYTSNISSNYKQQMSHEPTNELINYFINNNYLNNKSTTPYNGNFNNLIFKDEPNRITTSSISNYGIKSATGIGAFGFYRDSNGKTIIKTPINYSLGKPIGEFEINQTDSKIIFNLQQFSEIYEWYRFVFNQGLWSYEFKTNTLQGEFEKPFNMNGEFLVTCQGFRRELYEFSEISNPISVNITKRTDILPYIDQNIINLIINLINNHDISIGSHEHILDKINQVNIDLNTHNTDSNSHNDIRIIANNANSLATTALYDAYNAQISANNALNTANTRATYDRKYNVPINTLVPIYAIDGSNFSTANESYRISLTAIGTSSNSRSVFRINCGANPTIIQINSSGGVINPTVVIENGVVGIRQSGAQTYTIAVIAEKGYANASGYGASHFLDNAYKL